jgi:serine phosphatase RsbU (regulator of sigma subunit)
MTSGPEAHPFHAEYEHELERWLRRRFAGLCVTLLIWWTLTVGWGVLMATVWADPANPIERASQIPRIAFAFAALLWVSLFYFRERAHLETRAALLRASTLLLMGLGGGVLLTWGIGLWFAPDEAVSVPTNLLLLHLLACLFLPWTPRESLRPMLPLYAVWATALLLLYVMKSPGPTIAAILFAPLIFVPGALISHMRLSAHRSRFHIEMTGRDLRSLRQELAQARRIHESMFPAPYDDGHVKLEYTYLPQRDIGGDYLHLNVSPTGIVMLTVLDVTGHGLAAAMTVNRLFGEIERVQAEHPRIGPGEMMALLNRYVHLTLSRYNIYVTAVCMSIDPYTGRLAYTNAGHPPVFLRGVDGEVKELHATSILLGASGDADFESEELTANLRPGDALVAYTDGAFEACNRHGERLGLRRLRDLMRANPPPRQWTQALAAAVERHHAGLSDDDVLIAALTFVAPRGQTGRTAAARTQPFPARV